MSKEVGQASALSHIIQNKTEQLFLFFNNWIKKKVVYVRTYTYNQTLNH